MAGRGEEEEDFIDEEESSQCSSGCQSGWTLYLEHSGSAGQQQCSTLPCHPADVRGQMSPQEEYYNSDEEDSMVSDASSGPPPHLRDDEEELLQVQRHFCGEQCCDSGIDGGRRRSAGVSGSRSLVSTRSRSSGEAKSRKKRRAVVQRKDEAALNRYGVVDDDDLDDTASSSAVVASADVVEAIHLRQPSRAFLAEHCSSLEWPAV